MPKLNRHAGENRKTAEVIGVSPVSEKVEELRKKEFVEKMSFEPGVEERRSNGWWQWWWRKRCVKSDESDKSSWSAGRQSSLGSWFQRQGDVWRKERLLTFREEEEGGQKRVTTSEEQVIPWGWTEIRLYKYEGWIVCKRFFAVEKGNNHLLLPSVWWHVNFQSFKKL